MNDMRKLLALLIVGTWMGSIIIILFLMIFGLVDIKSGQELIKTFSSVTSGFVGMVIGYFFTGNKPTDASDSSQD